MIMAPQILGVSEARKPYLFSNAETEEYTKDQEMLILFGNLVIDQEHPRLLNMQVSVNNIIPLLSIADPGQ